MSLGYVVIEWNQASHQPAIACGGELHDTEEEAQACASMQRADAIHVGRREQYTLALVEGVEDE